MGLKKGQKKGRAASKDHHFGEVSGLDCFGDFQWPLLFVWIKRGWWELSPSSFPEAESRETTHPPNWTGFPIQLLGCGESMALWELLPAQWHWTEV